MTESKWAVQIVLALHGQPRRFNDLRRTVSGISKRMLSSTLKSLQRDGLVTRIVLDTSPPRVQYALTEQPLDPSR